jgi:hypothetical protein
MSDFTREEIEAVVQESRKLQRVNLAGIDLRRAKYSKDTKFPEGFDLEAAGMVLVE